MAGKEYRDHPDRIKWDSKYGSNPDLFGRGPSDWLLHCYPTIERLISLPATALDIGAGPGRNSLALARRGFDVTALDISGVALERLGKLAEAERLDITTVRTSAYDWDWAPAVFSLVIDFFYLERPLIPKIAGTVVPGGLICFETYTTGQLDAPVSPKCPREFLLEPGELPTLFDGFETLESREGPLPDGRVTAAWLGRRVR
ncbi:MAG: methyltransferase domain-containing protein [Deltaproteobacteria bacterium]|nr:methyltransferase domain-containing protein [Deltaproteobacteria bacterium]